MAVTSFSPELRYRAFTALGVTAPGAQLYTYASGSSALQTAYSDSTGLTPLSNPIVADGGGLFPAIWLTNAVAYRIVVYDQNGVLIWGPVDGVTLGTAGTTAASTLTGQVSVANGGTGQASLTARGVLIGEGTSAVAQTAAGSVGFVLTGQGASADPIFQAQDNRINDFRLTLTSVTPVTSADITAATTLYWTPYAGNRIALYDGSAGWNVRTSAELNIAIPGTTSQVYDAFVYDNAGTPTLEVLAWTNDTTRAVALVLQDGVYVKTGVTTRRYVGSFRTTTVSGQTEDSAAKRYVWNYYNRVSRILARQDPTANWNYTTAVVRQANGAAANQLDVVVGVQEVPVEVLCIHLAANASANVSVQNGIGFDSTTTIAAGSVAGFATAVGAAVAGAFIEIVSTYKTYPSVGRHVYVWLENAVTASGTTTWYGATNSGIFGTVMG